jgi:Ca2+-binding EF-hand superfamily protein
MLRSFARQEMINKLDVDGSGEIEFDEFKAILT